MNPNGLAAQYEANLPNVLEELKSKEKKERDLDRLNHEKELEKRRQNYRLNKNHILHLNESLEHLPSGIKIGKILISVINQKRNQLF